MSKRKKRLADELGPFLKAYRRPAKPQVGPNDRKYSHEIQSQVKRLSAEEFAALLDSGRDADIVAAHELGLAQFLKAERQDRFRQLLRSERGRTKLRASLAHFRDLDAAVCQAIVPSMHWPANMEAILGQRGAPAVSYAISEDDQIDGMLLPLREALDSIIGRGSGTLLSCIPGRLGYFEGEGPKDRWILVSAMHVSATLSPGPRQRLSPNE